MLPNVKNYAIYPSVVPADQEVELTIVPTENSFLFFENEKCALTIIAIDGDEEYYYEPRSHKKLSVTAEDGVIRFKYAFEGEGEHSILLCREDGKSTCELGVYSLYPDLLSKRVLRGDFHAHSYRSDGQRDPAALAGHFREQGYDFFALTDHNRAYPGEEIDAAYQDNPVDFARVFGEEVHAPGSIVHIIHVGGKASVAAQYVHNMENYEKEIEEYSAKVPDSIPEKYHGRYARAMWACDKIHEAGGLAVFVHPYWKPGASQCFNVCSEFARILLTSGMFDAYELVGGMGQEGVNRSVALWNDLRSEGMKMPVVGSSDVHVIDAGKADTFPYYFTLCFADENENDAIIDAVKNGLSVAVEMSGYDHTAQHRVYGSLRLVSYAHFLLRRYYPEFKRICQAEGIAMRAYTAEQAPRELLSLLAKETELYRRRFFGQCKAPMPSEKIRAYIEQRREMQRKGPQGKGGRIDTNNAQI